MGKKYIADEFVKDGGTSSQYLMADGSTSTGTGSEVNDLTSSVTWADVPDANITESSVTQHESAIEITESQISDLGSYIDGSGAADYIPKFSDSDTLTASIMYQDGTTGIAIGKFNASEKLDVGGNVIADAFKVNGSSSSDVLLGDGTLIDIGQLQSPLTTKGDLFSYNTGNARLGVGLNGQVLTADSTEAIGIKWATPSSGVTDHTLLSNIGTNTHAQIDTHIGDTTLHYTQASISITESQISDLGVYLEKGADILSNQNADNYTTSGFFNQNSNANAATNSNFPVAKAGMLIVWLDGAFIYQTFREYNYSGGNRIYNRQYYNGSWSTWEETYTTRSFTNNSSNWNTAFGWGDHSTAGYITTETNDLSSSVTWANVPNANITQSSVTQHQAALSIAYTQLTGTPTIPTNNNQLTNGANYITTADIDKAFVDALNVDADTLDSQDGSYYLNYNNFTNTPTIPSGNQIIDWTVDQGATNINTGNYINTTYTVGDGGLTQNNFTNTLKTKLDGIAAGAEVNVQSDWNSVSGDSLILNKPTIPTNNNQLTNGAGYITGYTVTESDVTTHQAALSITESQISDLTHITNNNQITNGAGYITSFDITTQTDPKYLRSNADDSTTGNLTASSFIKSGGTSSEILMANGSVTTAIKEVKALSVEEIGASENILLWYTTEAITISSIHTAVSGTSPSVTFNVKSGSSRASLTVQTFTSNQAATSTTGESFTINTANIAANNWIALITSASTASTRFDISISYIKQ